MMNENESTDDTCGQCKFFTLTHRPRDNFGPCVCEVYVEDLNVCDYWAACEFFEPKENSDKENSAKDKEN